MSNLEALMGLSVMLVFGGSLLGFLASEVSAIVGGAIIFTVEMSIVFFIFVGILWAIWYCIKVIKE